MAVKKRIKKQKINGAEFVNMETGEMLGSNATAVTVIDTELMVMHSEEYVILDSNALAYIQANFNPVDLGRILKMADMTYGEYNVLYNKTVPHNRESLMEELQYSRNKFSNFLKRLEMKSIIYYITGYHDGKRVKYFMLNPHLARKRKTIHRECLKVFQPLND